MCAVNDLAMSAKFSWYLMFYYNALSLLPLLGFDIYDYIMLFEFIYICPYSIVLLL